MIKNKFRSLLLTVLTICISGCTSGKRLITISNQYEVKPISYNAQFNLSTRIE